MIALTIASQMSSDIESQGAGLVAAIATGGGSRTLIPPSGPESFVGEPGKAADASKVVPDLAKRELERDGKVGALQGCLLMVLEEEDEGLP